MMNSLNTKSLKMSFDTPAKGENTPQATDKAGASNYKGRPRAIRKEMEPIILQLRAEGKGYRTIALVLRKEYGGRINWSSIRNYLKGRSCYGAKSLDQQDQNGFHIH